MQEPGNWGAFELFSHTGAVTYCIWAKYPAFSPRNTQREPFRTELFQLKKLKNPPRSLQKRRGLSYRPKLGNLHLARRDRMLKDQHGKFQIIEVWNILHGELQEILPNWGIYAVIWSWKWRIWRWQLYQQSRKSESRDFQANGRTIFSWKMIKLVTSYKNSDFKSTWNKQIRL